MHPVGDCGEMWIIYIQVGFLFRYPEAHRGGSTVIIHIVSTK
jgi:hypothetical protein